MSVNEDQSEFLGSLLGSDVPMHVLQQNRIQDEVNRLEKAFASETKEGRDLTCPQCLAKISSRWNLKRHMKNVHKRDQPGHSTTSTEAQTIKTCPTCAKSFASKWSLGRHIKAVHQGSATQESGTCFQCRFCSRNFRHKRSLIRHTDSTHAHKCSLCKKMFDSKEHLADHARRHLNSEYLTLAQVRQLRKQAGGTHAIPNSSQGQPRSPKNLSTPSDLSASSSDTDSDNPEPEPSYPQEYHRFLNGTGVRILMKPFGSEVHDLLGFFSNRRSQLGENIELELERMKGVKFYCCVKARMMKYDPEGNIRDQASPTFRSVAAIVLTRDGLGDLIDTAYFKISASLDAFKRSGSGWVLDEIFHLEQTILKYRPLRGACAGFKLPEILSRKACLLNVVGRPADSADCFLWCVIAGLHSTPDVIGERHWTEFSQYRNEIRFEPQSRSCDHVSVAEVEPFEVSNMVSVHVFGWEDDTIFPLHISNRVDTERGKHVNLLLLQSEGTEPAQEQWPSPKGHYCVIQDLDRLAFKQCATGNRHRRFICVRCLNPKSSERVLQEHMRLCNLTEPLKVFMPEEEKRWHRFRNYQRQLEVPFVIVAQFACFTKPIYDTTEPTTGRTVRERKLEPCAFAYFRLSIDDFHPSEPVVYVGNSPEDVMEMFMNNMAEEEGKVFEILSNPQPMIWCDRGLSNIEASNDACYICDKQFLPGQKVCIDHSHVTGMRK